jgi:hypothetical protein
VFTSPGATVSARTGRTRARAASRRLNEDDRDALAAALTAREHGHGHTQSFEAIVVPIPHDLLFEWERGAPLSASNDNSDFYASAGSEELPFGRALWISERITKG